MNDFSFLRLLPNFHDAKFQEISGGATLVENFEQIVLSPSGYILQKSNNPLGIAFDGLVKVFLVDLCDNIVQEITQNVAITEVIDANGTPQIYFEIHNTGIDFYSNPLCLKFKSTASNNVWWSNPILVTDSFVTTQFQYKNVSDLFYQSINLACYFSTFNAESNSESYTSFDGIKRTSRLINTEFKTYIFDFCNNFAYRRLNYLLSSNILYADTFLVTNKQTIESEERQGDTDVFSLDFTIAVDFNEVKNQELQIFQKFDYLEFIPIGQTTLPVTQLQGKLNNICTLEIATITLYKNNDIIGNYTQADVILVGQDFTIEIGEVVDAFENYKVLISEGLFKDTKGVPSPSVNDWQFTVSDGYYDEDFYNENFYLI